MANKKSNDKDLQKEFEELKSQFSELVQVLKSNGEETSDNLKQKLQHELKDYQDKAEEKLSDIKNMGTASLEEMSERIRHNPVSSLLLAFGAGYILLKILKND